MLTLIIWVLAFAYGRMTDALSWKPFAVLLAAAALISYLFPAPEMPGFAYNLGANMALGCVLFMLGYGFGQWRKSARDGDGFSD